MEVCRCTHVWVPYRPGVWALDTCILLWRLRVLDSLGYLDLVRHTETGRRSSWNVVPEREREIHYIVPANKAD